MPDYVALNEAQTVSETDPFTDERYVQFHRHLDPSALRILDVGCNTGRGGKVLKELRPAVDIVGLDCVQSRLDRLLQGVYSGVICSFTTDIASPVDRFDAIVAGEFIEHLAESDVDPTLLEFLRVLQPGGTLMMTTPNPAYLRWKIYGGGVLGGAHLSEHLPSELARRLRRLGFEKVQIRPSGKVTRYLGEWWPIMSFYGSYLIFAQKPSRVPGASASS